MQEIPNIITERVDDIPLLLEQRQRMGLPTRFDDHCPPHGNWTGLSLGWVSTLWLSAIVSRGDHRMVPVEPWGAKRLWTLGTTTGQAVTRVDCPDDRREIVRRRLRDDTRWAAFASALHQHTVRVYALWTARGHVESPSGSADTMVTAGGLFHCGPSTDDRPALPQITVMQAVLDPLGRPLVTDGVSGERADAPLSVPCRARVQARGGRRGLLSVGDGKMASHETRACIAASGDFSLCPLPQVPLAAGALAAAREAVWRGARTRIPVVRERPDGRSALIAEGEESPGPMRQAVGGTGQSWTARRLLVRSVRYAPAAEAALRARVAKAMAQMEALNPQGRGTKRVEEVSAFRQAVVAMVPRDGVEHLVWFRLTQHATPRPGRAYRGRPARIEAERQATVAVGGETVALAAAVRRWGWRV